MKKLLSYFFGKKHPDDTREYFIISLAISASVSFAFMSLPQNRFITSTIVSHLISATTLIFLYIFWLVRDKRLKRPTKLLEQPFHTAASMAAGFLFGALIKFMFMLVSMIYLFIIFAIASRHGW
jgi:hypothetical protein